MRESDLCVHHQYVYVNVDLAFKKQSLKMHPLTVYTGETLSLRCLSVRKRLISVSVFKCFGRSTVKRIEENSNDVFHCLYNVNKMHINTDTVKWGTHSWLYRRNDITQGWDLCNLKYRLGEGWEKKEKMYYNMGYLNWVTHSSTSPAQQGLTTESLDQAKPCDITRSGAISCNRCQTVSDRTIHEK